MSDISFEHVLSSQYTVFDGLAGMHVEDIYQDRQGFLWVATADGGVSRFDSAHFDNFGLKDGLPNLTVMAIAEDADGRLLFGTFGGGLAAYDGRGFQVYTTEHGLPSNEIVGLQAQPDGSILVLTCAGVAWFAEGSLHKEHDRSWRPTVGVRVYDMATDAAGTTWLAAMDWRSYQLRWDSAWMSATQAIQVALEVRPRSPLVICGLAFRYTGSEVLIGRYNPHERAVLQFINAAIGDRGEACRTGRGTCGLTRGAGCGCLVGGWWYTTGRSGIPFSTSLPDIDFSDYAPEHTRIARAISGSGFGAEG